MQQAKKSTMDIFFVFSLFGLYTLASLFLIVIGANIYSTTISSSESNYNLRTSVLYLSEKTRQNEKAGGVRTDTLNGSAALVLPEEIDGDVYETWIYVEDGYLSEVFVPEDTTIPPGIGQNIMLVSEVDFEIDRNNLLHISITDVDNEEYNSQVYLECTT